MLIKRNVPNTYPTNFDSQPPPSSLHIPTKSAVAHETDRNSRTSSASASTPLGRQGPFRMSTSRQLAKHDIHLAPEVNG